MKFIQKKKKKWKKTHSVEKLKIMKWVKLEEHLAPAFMKQIDQVCEIYISNTNYNLIIF